MRSVFYIILLLSGLSSYGQNDEALVRKTFSNYKSAILSDSAKDALHVIDSRTKKYYADILNDIKRADSIKIDGLSLTDKLTILVVRAKAPKEEILNMQGTDVFLFAIRNGMVGKNGVVNASIGKVTIVDGFAKGYLNTGGKESTASFNFYKENGEWKLDLTSLFALSNLALKNMVEESDKSENVFLMEIIEVMVGKGAVTNVWQPLM